MKRLCLHLLFIPLLLPQSVYQNAYALANSKPALVYGIPHYPPNSIIEDSGYSGRDVELLNILAKRMDIEIQYSPCEWIRCLEMAKAGKVDILTSLALTPERETFIHYVLPAYSPSAVHFWVRKGEANTIKKFEDLIPLNIGKEKGAQIFSRIDDNPDIKPYESADIEILLKMLVSKRLDTVMGDSKAVGHIVEQSEFASQLELATFKHQVPSAYLGLSRQSDTATKWLPEFQQHMEEMVLSGDLESFLFWRDSSQN